MRRAVAAFLATVAGLALLLSYKSSPGAASRVPAAVPATTGPPSRTTAPPPSSAGGGAVSGTFTGPVVNTRYGPVQVQVTLANGTLTDVRADELPSDRSRSASLSNLAAPVLRSEALAAQGAKVDSVSGASITSRAYAQSLQAALDAARR